MGMIKTYGQVLEDIKNSKGFRIAVEADYERNIKMIPECGDINFYLLETFVNEINTPKLVLSKYACEIVDLDYISSRLNEKEKLNEYTIIIPIYRTNLVINFDLTSDNDPISRIDYRVIDNVDLAEKIPYFSFSHQGEGNFYQFEKNKDLMKLERLTMGNDGKYKRTLYKELIFEKENELEFIDKTGFKFKEKFKQKENIKNFFNELYRDESFMKTKHDTITCSWGKDEDMDHTFILTHFLD